MTWSKRMKLYRELAGKKRWQCCNARQPKTGWRCRRANGHLGDHEVKRYGAIARWPRAELFAT